MNNTNNRDEKMVALEEQKSFTDTGSETGSENIDASKPITIEEKVKKSTAYVNRNKPKKERFLWLKVWTTYFLSLFMKGRGKIPDNIGDRILITNNTYLTKDYMSSIIHITELGVDSPITLLEVLNAALRERGNKAILDFVGKNRKYHYDPKDSGLESRIRMWNNNLESDMATKKMKERSVRCLYTVKVAESGKQLKETRMFLTIRAKDIGTLNVAEKIIYDMLNSMKTVYMPVCNNVKETLEYISLIGDTCADLKTKAPVLTSNVILSQIVPNCGSFNDKKGLYIGQNLRNGSPFLIDFSSITVARDCYVVAPSGVGKTALATNMLQSAYEIGYACCTMDIKGNEYTNFINATDGYVVSLRPTSIEYINSWVMRKEDTTCKDAEIYFKSRINFSKQQMIILSGVTDRETLLQLEELLDEFHDAMYITLGAIPTNINSWSRTESLNPYEVFSKLEIYLTPQKRAQYNIHSSVLGRLRMFMSPTGSKSYVFKREFDYAKIINSRTLSFDFGILSNKTISDIDTDLFRLKFLYMSKLNEEFTANKYARGMRTLKILEESQIVTPEITEMYVLEYTLRRSQKQDTILLGNSVQALKNKDIAKPLIENTRGLFVGELTKEARETIMDEFGIHHLEPLLMIPGSKPKYKNSFFFMNNMQSKNLYPIIKVQIEPGEDGKPRMYKVNTPVKESNAMSG